MSKRNKYELDSAVELDIRIGLMRKDLVVWASQLSIEDIPSSPYVRTMRLGDRESACMFADEVQSELRLCVSAIELWIQEMCKEQGILF